MVRIYEVYAQRKWHIEQDAAADDTVAGLHDGVAHRAPAADFARRTAIVHHAFAEDVAQGIQVSADEDVKSDADVIERRFHARQVRGLTVLAGHHHEMLRGTGVRSEKHTSDLKSQMRTAN